MSKWYTRGDLGEYVLSQVEAMIDKQINVDTFISILRDIGLNDQEIMDLYAEDVLGV